METKKRFGQRLAKTLLIAAFTTLLLLPASVGARILSGGVTERKTNRKITSMLRSARKSSDSGKVQTALDSYWKILELDPNETLAYLELGELYVNLRIYDRAVELLEPGLNMAQREMDKDSICYYYCILTQAHLGLNQTGEANKALIKAAEASPKNPMPRKILGDIYLANNRIADALKAYKKALELNPEYTEAQEKLGEITAKYGAQTPLRTKNKDIINQKAVKLPANNTIATNNKNQAAPQKLAPQPTIQQRPKPDALPTDNSKKPVIDDMVPMPMPLPAPTSTARVIATATMPTDPTPAATDKKEALTVADRPVPMPAAVAIVPLITPAIDTTATAAANVDDTPASETQIEEQIDKLLAGSVEEKKAATIFFVRLEEKGLTEVEELLYDSDPDVRIIAIRILPEFKAFEQRVKTMLMDASEDPDKTVIEEIKRALKSFEK